MFRYIKAQAEYRSDYANELENHSYPCAFAITQLYVFPKSEYENHWKREVWLQYNKGKKIRPKKKLPSSDFVFNNIWDSEYDSNIKSLINSVITKEYELIPDPERANNEKQLSRILREYFCWLSEQLSTHSLIDPNSVYMKLDELGL